MRKITLRVSDEAYEWLESRPYDGSISGLGGFLLESLADPKQPSGHMRQWLSQLFAK